MRQLWVNIFGVHNMKTSASVLYTYHESIARKGSSEVCTFLLNYLTEYVPHSVKELRLFSDGAAAQNKNHIMIRLCQALVDTKKVGQITILFPGTRKLFKKVDLICYVKQYCELLLNEPKQPNKFTINLVETSGILNFVERWPTMYKRGGISKESRKRDVANTAKYSSENQETVATGEFIEGLMYNNFNLKLKHSVTLPTEQAYEGPTCINYKNIEDLKKLRIYIPEEYTGFFREILMWLTTHNDSSDNA
ncbi:hypothetical protein PR048_032516 [Dryococelus australis]|uniref:DUF4371 domain-containing protein n=1 Tax=Dryococelus australis TaxID=614101 RepID=A0ABQ9G2F0_9NEOP|nr:hypothetical protein PR048_032516 [Dryococelus australis]